MIEDAKTMLNSFQSWYVGHTNREANKMVHRLAKAAIHQSLEQVWIEKYLGFISNIVLS